MKPKNNIIKILESLGYIVPLDAEGVAEFEKRFKKEIEAEKPKYWDNPVAMLYEETSEEESFFNDEYNTYSEGLARAARQGKEIPDEVKRLMEDDRNNAEEN